MNDTELSRKLNSVGKTAFALFVERFRDYASGKISKQALIEELVTANVSNESGAAIRCSNAKLIFEAGRELDALRLIVDSSKLDEDVKLIAKAKITKLNQSDQRPG